MKNYNSRNEELKIKFNSHFQRMTGDAIDYYSALKDEDILELKTVLSDINNLLTYKLTLVAGDWIGQYFKFNADDQKELLEKIDSSKPNAQGYDIVIEKPVKIIAEVKCNVPVRGGSKYGSAQTVSLIKDVQKLLNGKRQKLDTSEYLKFLFVINIGDRSDGAMTKLIRKTKVRKETEERLQRNFLRDSMIILTDEMNADLNTEKVYIKTLSLI